MDVLDYYTPRKAKPFPIRLTDGLRADAVTLIRGFFVFLFLISALGRPRIVCTAGYVWLAQWAPDDELVLMRLDSPYAERLDSGWFKNSEPDCVSTILNVGTVKKSLGVEIGYWPSAPWIRLPFPSPLILSILALLLVWRFTRIKPTKTAPSPK